MVTNFDTRSIAPHERQAFWQEVVCATFVPLECKIGGERPFSGQLSARDLGSLTVVDICATEQQVRRNSHCIARSLDEYVLVSLVHEGRSQILQDGREAFLDRGDFAIYDTRSPYELRLSEFFHQTVLQIPHQVFREHLGNIEKLTAITLSRKDPIARLTFDYLVGLAGIDDSVVPESRDRLTRQGVDLLATALGEHSHQMIHSTTKRSSLLYRIKTFMRANLANDELSLANVASHFGITTRYINSLFQDEQTSFGRFLLAARLQACAEQLRSDAQQAVAISTIAYRSGFTDMSYFSRVFKARFGLTAREFRQH